MDNYYCQGTWDEELKKYDYSNPVEAIECCIKNCSGSGLYKKSCTDNCKKYLIEPTKEYILCAEDNECGIYPNLDIEKLKAKKTLLLDCCKKNCISTLNKDCERVCKSSHNFFTNFIQGEVENFTMKSKNYFYPLLLVSLFSFFSLLVIDYFLKFHKK